MCSSDIFDGISTSGIVGLSVGIGVGGAVTAGISAYVIFGKIGARSEDRFPQPVSSKTANSKGKITFFIGSAPSRIDKTVVQSVLRRVRFHIDVQLHTCQNLFKLVEAVKVAGNSDIR